MLDGRHRRPGGHRRPRGHYAAFYGCYLLRSSVAPSSFYVGSTPNPYRRLRQHNGELRSGGAYRTGRGLRRPWDMVLLVSGFPSKTAALMFEHALHHAHQCRHIPPARRVVSAGGGGGGNLNKHLANVRLLLNSRFFSRLPLRITFFDLAVYHQWAVDKCGVGGLNANVEVQLDTPVVDAVADEEDVQAVQEDVQAVQEDVAEEEALDGELEMDTEDSDSDGESDSPVGDSDQRLIRHRIGSNTLDISLNPYKPLFTKSLRLLTASGVVPNTPLAVCPHESCEFIGPLTTLARTFLEAERARSPAAHPVAPIEPATDPRLVCESRIALKPAIPLHGLCPGCGRGLRWGQLARNATMIMDHFSNELNTE